GSAFLFPIGFHKDLQLFPDFRFTAHLPEVGVPLGVGRKVRNDLPDPVRRGEDLGFGADFFFKSTDFNPSLFSFPSYIRIQCFNGGQLFNPAYFNLPKAAFSGSLLP
ncbi:MAG: hypothetical protein WC082_13600, partial [Victivallales bacterium]